MSSDRGTIPRADMGAWPEPTAPSGRRLPSAPRERKPVLAALAGLLVVGGALIAALLVIDAGHKTGAVEITQSVGQGQRITASMLKEVQVTSGGDLNYVPWDEASQVTRTYAATQIPPGTLLTQQMTTSSNQLAKGMDVIGLAIKDGQMPDNLQVGDHIDVFETSDASGRCPRPTDDILSTNAVVLNITRPLGGSTGSAANDVQVAVNPSDAAGVSCNAANSNVSVGVLPANGAGSSTPSSGSSSGSSSTGGSTSPGQAG